MKTYDLIVVGGGAAGLTAAAGAASIGAKVALVEKNEQPGGDCLHYGCVPSKALIEVANQVHKAQQTDAFGLSVNGVIEMEKVTKRVHDSVQKIAVHDDADRFRKLGVDVYIGKGSFVSRHEIQVENGPVITGKRIVISTGSRPFIPPIPGLEDAGYLTNETVFSLKELPPRLLVIGGGPIGLELAQALSRLGAEVTVVEAGEHILAKEDKQIRERAVALLKKELTILTGASVTKVEKTSTKKRIWITRAQKEAEQEVHEVDEILVAAGRISNTKHLQLSQAGVEVDKRGNIPVNEQLQTNVSSIYAIGDVNGSYPFTHAAGMEGKLAVQNAVLGLRRKLRYDHFPWVTFTAPEIFHLGKTEEELQEARRKYEVYTVPLEEVDRFVADQETAGFVKMITDKRGYILGAHAIGKGAGDFMQEVVFAKQHGHKIGDLSHVIHPYPNHAAAVQRTADLFWRKKLFQGKLPRVLRAYIRWLR